jgi:hypothetical protein
MNLASACSFKAGLINALLLCGAALTLFVFISRINNINRLLYWCTSMTKRNGRGAYGQQMSVVATSEVSRFVGVAFGVGFAN